MPETERHNEAHISEKKFVSNDREETKLEKAVRQVAETKRFIAEQRERIEKLKVAGISSTDAEHTLDVLCSSLPFLKRYEKYVREHFA